MESIRKAGDQLLEGKAIIETVVKVKDVAAHRYTIVFPGLPGVATNVPRQATFEVGYSGSGEFRLRELEMMAMHAYRKAERDATR